MVPQNSNNRKMMLQLLIIIVLHQLNLPKQQRKFNIFNSYSELFGKILTASLFSFLLRYSFDIVYKNFFFITKTTIFKMKSPALL